MKPEEAVLVYAPTATARPVFIAAGGEALPDRLPVVPVAGDELQVGAEVFRVLRRRIDPGPPVRIRLTLDHPAQGRNPR